MSADPGDPGHPQVRVDFELRPGEDVDIDEGAGAMAAARRFRDVLGRFAAGVTVVTSTVDGRPVGMTCQAFTSVSLEPPLVLFVAARSSRAWPAMRRSGVFCVNFLAADQQHLSRTMATRGIDKFAGVDWRPAEVTGSPVLAGTVGHVDCAVHAVHEAGDHDVVVGRVVGLVEGEDRDPLLFHRGRYGTVR